MAREPEVLGVCERFSKIRPKDIIAGTTYTEVCSLCGERVCTAPSMSEVIANNGREQVQLICIDCFKQHQLEGEFMITPAQIRELRAHHKLEGDVER